MDGLRGLHGYDIVWNSAVGIDDLPTIRTAQHLENEDDDVQYDDRNCYEGECMGRIVVFIGKHFLLPVMIRGRGEA